MLDLDTLKKYLIALGVDITSYTDDMLINLLELKTAELEGIIGYSINPAVQEELHHDIKCKAVLTNFYPILKTTPPTILLDGTEISPIRTDWNKGIFYFEKKITGNFLEVKYEFGLSKQADKLVSMFIADYILNKRDGTEGSPGYQRVKSKSDGKVSITYDYADTKDVDTKYKAYIDQWIKQFQNKYRCRASLI